MDKSTNLDVFGLCCAVGEKNLKAVTELYIKDAYRGRQELSKLIARPGLKGQFPTLESGVTTRSNELNVEMTMNALLDYFKIDYLARRGEYIDRLAATMKEGKP